MSKTTDRNLTIDFIKGIGIVLMVMGHSESPATRFIYLFHMSLFFITAGYCLDEKYTDSFTTYMSLAKKRVQTLYFPCLSFNLVIVLLHNSFFKLNIIGDAEYSKQVIFKQLIKCFMFSGGESLSGAMWFLRTMFLSTLIYVLICSIIRKIVKSTPYTLYFEFIVFFTILIVSWRTQDEPYSCYLNCLTVLILFYYGKLVRHNKQLIHPWLAIPSLVTLIVIYSFTDVCISLNNNHIYNPIIYLVCSFSGFILCHTAAMLLGKFSYINKLFCYIGRHTLPIVMLHFGAMKLVTLVEVLFYGCDIDALKSYPVFISAGGWWLAYTMTGISIPLLCYMLYTTMVKITVSGISNK